MGVFRVPKPALCVYDRGDQSDRENHVRAIDDSNHVLRTGSLSTRQALLSNWRKQLTLAETPDRRGRPINRDALEEARLRKENERLQWRLDKSEVLVDALGKVYALLQLAAGESALDEQPSKKS